MDEFLAWLNPKGNRELALKNALTKWWPHIAPGIRKRITVRFLMHLWKMGTQADGIQDLNVTAKLPDARRSARTKGVSGYDILREPYMVWTNRRAVTSS